jgi:WD40 repeat protein
LGSIKFHVMPVFTREMYLENFVYAVEEDFQKDGQPAAFASGFPKYWGQEDAAIEIPPPDDEEPINPHDAHLRNRIYTSFSSAVSPDQKLLAISYGNDVYIYDIATKQLRQKFPEQPEIVQDLFFCPRQYPSSSNSKGKGKSPEHANQKQKQEATPDYTLVTAIHPNSGLNPRLVFWDLTSTGSLLDMDESLHASFLARCAVAAIRPDLFTNYEWDDSDIEALGLAKSFQQVLRQADARHSTLHRTTLLGDVAKFGSDPFSSGGRYMLYLVKNGTTQQGMRPPEELPAAIVYDLSLHKDVCRLSGHTDRIMWAGFSPDEKFAASVAWDGTMRVYRLRLGEEVSESVSTTAELAWATEPSGGQNWAASFSLDGKYIAMSGKHGREIWVHEVDTGKMVSRFPHEFKRWSRGLEWRPTPEGEEGEYTLMVTAWATCYLWDALNEQCTPEKVEAERRSIEEQKKAATDAGKDANEVDQMIQLHPSIKQKYTLKGFAESGMRGFVNVNGKWLEDGKKLLVQCTEGSFEIYDIRENIKWRMERPKGTTQIAHGGQMYYLPSDDGEGTVLAITGDRKARFWKISNEQLNISGLRISR